MSGKVPPSIMERYSPSTMERSAESCHYDNLREHGFPRDAARRIARQAADVQARTLDGQADALAGQSVRRTPRRLVSDAERAGMEPVHRRVVVPSSWSSGE